MSRYAQYNPWQFASGYLDASTLYYKYGTRYYDRFGRWTQKDSVPSANPYLYVNDDPVNEVDPSGRATIGCILGLIASGAAFGAAVIEGGPLVLTLIQALIASAPLTGLVGPAIAGGLAIIAGAAWLTQAILYCNGIG